MVAAAVDGSGSVGGCPNCKILPVRLYEGLDDPNATPQMISDAIFWSADNADVINCSWITSPSSLITSAFSYAATSGRGGKGSVVTAATGNSASKWVGINFEAGASVSAGTWRFRFVVDSLYNPQKYAPVNIAYVQFPNGTVERFDSPGIPTGWTSDTPGTPWNTVDNLALSHGVGRYFLGSAPYLVNGEKSKVTTHQMTVSSASTIYFKLFIPYPDPQVIFRIEGDKWNVSGVPSAS